MAAGLPGSKRLHSDSCQSGKSQQGSLRGVCLGELTRRIAESAESDSAIGGVGLMALGLESNRHFPSALV